MRRSHGGTVKGHFCCQDPLPATIGTVAPGRGLTTPSTVVYQSAEDTPVAMAKRQGGGGWPDG